MYLAYKPPEMLPTQTLNPTATDSSAARFTGKTKRSFKDMDGFVEPMNKKGLGKRKGCVSADSWWWIGLGMTALGGVGYYCF